MRKKKVGLSGWRGMVGSVLMQRMHEENDFSLIEPIFLSTSAPGGEGPISGTRLGDAYDITLLKQMDVILTAQGEEYTTRVYPQLRDEGWDGYWIDAAKTLRMAKDAVIILDPINHNAICDALRSGVKNYIGGSCTVSCMLMGLGGLFHYDLVEWMTAVTYQAASGGGAQHMRELLIQSGKLYANAQSLLDDPGSAILDIDRQVLHTQQNFSPEETRYFGVPLAGNLIPWVDKDIGKGISLEEWKGMVETNKILGRDDNLEHPPVPIDACCVRIGAMRSHSQALTIKLRHNISLEEAKDMIASSTPWTRVIRNTREESMMHLTPVAVSGTLNIPVGRIRKLAMGDHYLGAFTVGDQLLWGAAEPLRRMLRILVEDVF